MKDSETAIAMVLVEAGSEYEQKENNGLSHFLEHMCFKGTKNRTGEEIRTLLDGLGTQSNAFTGEEYTGYYAKARYKKIDRLIDLVSDLYLNPIFPEKDIDTERGVIIEEINMYEDLPKSKVWDIWNELNYGEQPAGRSILGPKENIKSFKREDFVNYHKAHYMPNKTVVVVAGNIDRAQVIKLIQEKFGNLKKGKYLKKPKATQKKDTPKIKIHNKKPDQTHFVIGYESFDLHDERNYALQVAGVILGQGFSSRLFVRMREELGICYYVSAGNYTYSDRGQFLAYAGVGNERIQEAVDAILIEFNKLRDQKVDEAELLKAKDYIMGNYATGLETSDAWAMHYGFQELMHDKIKIPKEYEKKIRAVTASDIARVMKQVINPKTLRLAVVGPQDPKMIKLA